MSEDPELEDITDQAALVRLTEPSSCLLCGASDCKVTALLHVHVHHAVADLVLQLMCWQPAGL